MAEKLSRRKFLRVAAAGAGALLAASCQPKVVEVEKVVTKEVEKIVKETVEVEKIVKETVEVEKEVTKIVERVVEKQVTLVVEKVVPPAELSGELVFWAWDEPISELLKKGFEIKYPGVTAHHEIVQNYHQTFFTSLVAGAGLPDVAWCDSHTYQKLARTGQLTPLDELLVPYKEDILKFLWDAALHEGTQYGVPRRYAPEVVYYRTDRFEEAGIDPAKIDTWDDFVLLGKNATDEEHFMTCYDATGFDYAYQSMLFSHDGTGFFDAKDNVVVNSPENLSCTEKYLELTKSGVARPIELWGPDWYDAARTAQIACLVMPYWYGSEPRVEMPDNSGKWSLFAIPSLKAGVKNASVWQGAMYWVIPEKAESKELGWKFAEYTTFDYKDPYMQESMDREFVLPAYTKFLEIDYFWGDALLYFGSNLRKLAHELAQGAPVNYLPPEYNECVSILTAQLVPMYEGEMTPKQVLEKCEEEFKKLLEAR